MACPFFKAHYAGFCTASDCSYIPSIVEMEKKCFNDSFEGCSRFNGLDMAEKEEMAILNEEFRINF